jgi:dTDP-4-amino-4,6-dideoxygalactose transaminase
MALDKVPFVSFAGMNKVVRTEILSAFEAFFDNSWYILGEGVKAFENDYAKFNNTQYCVGISNGLDALVICLKTLGIGPGDEVIVPSNTYIATALAVSYVGAKPVFVEPKLDTYNLDPQLILNSLSPSTKAIIVVHLYGQACEMEEIANIAKEKGLRIIEDNAQAHGAHYNNRLTGSWGEINGTSFYPGKNLGAYGDGGAVTTNEEILATKASVLRNYGSSQKYYNEVLGYNMRLDECQAIFLSIKLRYLKDWTLQRQQIANWYIDALANTDSDLVLPVVAPGASHVYHLFVVRTSRRKELQQHLDRNGISTLIHYPVPPHLQEAYAFMNFRAGSFPIAELIADTCLSLPLWPGMTPDDVMKVSTAIKDFYKA